MTHIHFKPINEGLIPLSVEMGSEPTHLMWLKAARAGEKGGTGGQGGR